MVDLDVARPWHPRTAVGGVGGLGQDRAGGQAGSHSGEPGAVRGPLEELAA